MPRNDIEPKLQKIETYFQEKEFYIPAYQRPYAWRVSECDKLIEDIENHQEDFDDSEQDDYFFGTILISKDDEDKQHDTTLIDGQQRTTTFMLLLKAILLKVKSEIGLLTNDEDRRTRSQLETLRDKLLKMIYNFSDDECYDYIQGDLQPSQEHIKYVNDSIAERYSNDLSVILLSETFEEIADKVHKHYRKQKDNKYTNFFKNFRYFYDYCQAKTNTQIRDFGNHFIENCQIISIISYHTDQAINIFNSLNGTGLPLTEIEVIVSKIIANSADKVQFQENWKEIVEKSDNSDLGLTSLITHFIYMTFAEQGKNARNPGVRKFFAENNEILKNDQKFTYDLNTILDNIEDINVTDFGKLLGKFNNNIKYFMSSFLFFRNKSEDSKLFLESLLKLFALLDITEFGYSNGKFKTFLEKLNSKFADENISTAILADEINQHIVGNFDKEGVKLALLESGVKSSLVYLNEYLFSKDDFRLIDNTDIEHIMSVSGRNRENIMKDVGIDNFEEFHDYAEKLGNKILLESKINRGIGDAWFKTKKENTITSHHGYIGSTYQIAKSLVNYPKDTWNKVDIDTATERAAERIADFIFQ